MAVRISPVKTNYWGERFTLFAQRTFSGGIHTSVPPNEVDQTKDLADCENMVLTKEGILQTRPGCERVHEIGSSAAGLGSFGQSLVWATNGKVFVNGVEVGECDTSKSVKFIEFIGKLCILDGGPLKVYDGENFYVVEEAPQASFGLVRGNRLWLAGDPLNPSTLWYSGVNDLRDWGFTGLKLGGFFDINPTVGSYISAIALFFDTLLIFKGGNEKKIYRLDGSTQDNFTIREVLGGITCISHNTVNFTQIGTLFLSENGVFSFDGSQSIVVPISTKILNKLQFDYPEKTHAVFWTPEAFYILTYENDAYVLNINVGAWFRWKFPFKILVLNVIGDYCYLAGDDGWIYRLDWHTSKDGEVPISSEVKTAFYDFGDPGIWKYIKNVYLHLFPYGGGNFNFSFVLDYTQLRGQRNILLTNYVSETGLGWDNFLFGWDEEEFGWDTAGETILNFAGGAGWDNPLVGWDDEEVGWDTVIPIPLTVKLPVSARCRSIQFILQSPSTPFALYGLELGGAILRPV